jgi:Cupin-like domain
MGPESVNAKHETGGHSEYDDAEGDELARALRAIGLSVAPIPEGVPPTASKVREAIAKRRGPLLFRGIVNHWPAISAWTPENLVQRQGQKAVTALMDLPARGTLFPNEQQSYERTLPLSAFVERMLTTAPEAPCYLAYTRVDELFPATDYDFSELTGGARDGTDTRAWIGSAGTRSMLHSDLKDNFFSQIWGEKHVVLLPWEHSRAAYPFPNNIVNSRIDLAELDLARFPRLKDVTLYAGTVRPGDMVFIPRGCWHDMRSRTPSVSLNHWFGPPLTIRDYMALVLRLGPRFWVATARDFVLDGVLRRPGRTNFFFSPPSTGKRLYDRLRWGDFSRENDPAK